MTALVQIALVVLLVAVASLGYLCFQLNQRCKHYEKIEHDDYEARQFREDKLRERTATIKLKGIDDVVKYAKKTRRFDYFLQKEDPITRVDVKVVVDHLDNTVTGYIDHVIPESTFNRAKQNIVKDLAMKDFLE